MELPKVLLKGRFDFNEIQIIERPTNLLLPPDLREEVAQKWEDLKRQAKEKNIKVWDSINYRLNDFKIVNGILTLEIAELNFSTRVGLAEIREKLWVLGYEFFPRGLFIGTLLETNDGEYIFGERSKKSATRSRTDIIGGVLSKKEVIIKSGSDFKNALTAELSEEINVTKEHLLESYVMGLVLTDSTQVGIITYTKLNLSSEEVNDSFKNKNDGEMESLVFVDEDKLRDYLNNLGGYKPAIVELLN
jgi:hypothetical protein